MPDIFSKIDFCKSQTPHPFHAAIHSLQYIRNLLHCEDIGKRLTVSRRRPDGILSPSANKSSPLLHL